MLAASEYVERRSLGGSGLWPARRPKLHGLDIELTERCNNACQHCYINLPAADQQAGSGELATAEWQGIFRQAAELGALSLRITGGEPLLRPDFAELYLFARRLGLKVTLYTNARLITPDLAELFACVPPLEKIEITVYGMHSDSYDAAACAPGAYAEFRRGVDLLLEWGVPFLVKGALLPPNRGEMDEFEAWAATLPGMQGQRPGYAMLFDLRGRRDSAVRDRLIRRLRLAPEQVLDVLARDEARYRRDQAAFCSRFIGPAGARLFTCGAGLVGSVDAYGRLQPCMLLRDPQLSYDLRKGSLQDALETFFPQVRKLEATNSEYLGRCARCFLHGLCEQCPAKSWSEHGDLDTPVEYLCQVAHAQARWLGLLDEGERAWEVLDWGARLDRLNAENGKE